MGGFLTQAWGWRSVFWVSVPLGGLILVLALGRLRGEWAEARGESFDLVGSIIYGLALLGLMLGLSELPAAGGIALILASGADVEFHHGGKQILISRKKTRSGTADCSPD